MQEDFVELLEHTCGVRIRRRMYHRLLGAGGLRWHRRLGGHWQGRCPSILTGCCHVKAVMLTWTCSAGLLRCSCNIIPYFDALWVCRGRQVGRVDN
eukprot:6491516-Amphidinium_carterae.4